jgi:hypothetical protein
MVRSTRLFLFALLLIAAPIIVPSGLMQSTLGDNNKDKKIKPPDKPAVETVVEVGEASPIRCKGHILHGPKKQ